MYSQCFNRCIHNTLSQEIINCYGNQKEFTSVAHTTEVYILWLNAPHIRHTSIVRMRLWKERWPCIRMPSPCVNPTVHQCWVEGDFVPYLWVWSISRIAASLSVLSITAVVLVYEVVRSNSMVGQLYNFHAICTTSSTIKQYNAEYKTVPGGAPRRWPWAGPPSWRPSPRTASSAGTFPCTGTGPLREPYPPCSIWETSQASTWTRKQHNKNIAQKQTSRTAKKISYRTIKYPLLFLF